MVQIKHLIKKILKQEQKILVDLTCCGIELHDICSLKQVILMHWNTSSTVRYPTIHFKVSKKIGCEPLS